MRELAKAPPSALTTARAAEGSTDEARAQLVAARLRLSSKLDDVQRALTPIIQWQQVVKRHPLATIGGAFLIGYALSKLFSRKS